MRSVLNNSLFSHKINIVVPARRKNPFLLARLRLIPACLFALLICVSFIYVLQCPFITGISMKTLAIDVPKTISGVPVPKETTSMEKVALADQEIQSKFSYKSDEILSLEMNYPQIEHASNEKIQGTLNTYYQNAAKDFYNQAYGFMYSALDDYKNAAQTDYPFHLYESVQKYTVTMNENCRLSMFFDRYSYSGGAHGNTIRVSDNWDLQTGRKLKLKNLFKNTNNFRKLVLDQILLLADEQMRKDPIYFEDYRELIVKNFNAENFYLTPKGINVFYQQYEIGPYSSGIIVFEIPYKSLGIQPPACS